MRSTFLASLLLAAPLVLASGAHGQPSAGGVFPYPYERVDLDNGLRAYLIRAGAPGQVAYVTIVRTGSRDEVEAGKTGFAHFFEHVMFRGTARHPSYDKVAEGMGASFNATTGNDRTVYYLVAASEHLSQIVDLEADRFQRLSYEESAFRTEAGAVLGEYQNNAYSPFFVLDRVMRETAFEEHTYRHQTIGFEADVRAMPEGYAHSLDFYRRHYRPENTVVVLVGDFDLAGARRLIEEHYGGWERGYQSPQIPPEPPQRASRERTVRYPGRTLPIVSLNFKAPAWSATDRLAVATEVLGAVAFGPNSDLYRRLVLQEQRLQFLAPSFDLARDPSVVTVAAMVNDPADLEPMRAELLAEVRRLREGPVDAGQLEATKSNMKYSFLMGLETAQGVAFSLSQPVISTGGIEAIEDWFETLAAVTADDLREAARRYLDENGLTAVTLIEAGGAS
ncbi:MAG TPA: pitrilysin family protein [Thermoanaerobaculia bacterium]|nr:pitrilysin family protein [Thermoanaerobaculia bacterium]